MPEKKYHYLPLLFLVFLLIYTGAYLSLRKVDFIGGRDHWAVYFYGDGYVRQYALNKTAILLLKKSVRKGDTSYLADHDGTTGDNWFCVYRKPGTQIYRIFRLAEAVENQIVIHHLPQ